MIERIYPKDASVFDRIRGMFTGSISLLCIEDNPEICTLLCDEFFRSSIFNRKSADTFEKALKTVRSKELYHCWILDLSLDRHNDGLELLRMKRSSPYCVVASASRSLYDATVAIREGAYGAYDKNAIVTTQTNTFIREICSLSTLSFLLHAQKPERFDLFALLLSNFIRSPEEWSRSYCLNERSVRNICEDYSGLTARQFLLLFHVLNTVALSDCLVEGMSGFHEVQSDIKGKRTFHEECAAYVLRHFDKVYGPKYL